MNQDWEKWGKDIKNIVQSAIDSQDFTKLNQTITNTVSDAVSNIQKGLANAGQTVNQAADEVKKQTRNNIKNTPVSRPQELFKKNKSIKAGGIALSICGYIFGFGIGLAVFILCLVGMLMGNFFVGIKIALGILVPLLTGCIFMAWKGSSMMSALKRYQSYIRILEGRTYCNIQDLANTARKSVKYVRKDIQMMIDKGWFLEGHLDEQNACLMVSHKTYQEYQQLQKQKMEQKQAEIRQNTEKKQQMEQSSNTEMQRMIVQGKEYIQKIKECNDAISGEEISRKISHMELLIQRIFDRVKEEPDSIEDIQKLMEYYLPTTIKLLEAYQQLDIQPVQGENIMSSKQEIEQTLDTLNVAFERLLDSLFQDVAWDVSSDISVLHTMLAQEGLTGNDFQ